jgi:hypothetical protein
MKTIALTRQTRYVPSKLTTNQAGPRNFTFTTKMCVVPTSTSKPWEK